MFSGHWLVADMDGTLTPTPTRAGGKYLSFTESIEQLARAHGTAGAAAAPAYYSCLPALRLFIKRGGSLCVVSTAGKRMWRQMYTDLAPALHGVPDASTSATPPGVLLLCGFTGAALFRSREAPHVQALMRAAGPSVTSSASCAWTLPPPVIGLEEWVAYRRTAGALTAHGQETSDAEAACTTLDAHVRDAAVEEGRRAVVRFFEHVSFVSRHDAEAARAFFEGCLSTKYHAAYTDMLRRCLAEVRTTQPGVLEAMASGATPWAPICFEGISVFAEAPLSTHGTYLVETNDALVDAQTVNAAELAGRCTDPAVVKTMPAAQIVVMGIPMRYYHAIFPDTETLSASSSPSEASPMWHCCEACAAKGRAASARLTALGLTIKSQPNSVCIHRNGVDKETCVRWLEAHAHELGPTRHFSRQRALGFGDVPVSVDRPLWQFPPMSFISLSPLPHSGMDPVRDPAPTNGFYEVGGEEEGTGCFLDALLAACDGSADGPIPEEQTWFTEARVQACAKVAHEQVASWGKL